MRYRFFFDRQRGQLPIDVFCASWQFHSKATRRIVLYPYAGNNLTVDVCFPSRVIMVKDDHSRIVWPNAAAVIARAKRGAA